MVLLDSHLLYSEIRSLDLQVSIVFQIFMYSLVHIIVSLLDFG
jgi:hypothetical protein